MHYFPHDKIRPIQSELLQDIKKAIKDGSHLIANAPTGLGKTAASLAPALEYAKANSKCVFFLTSRHTQHALAIETIKLIKKYDKSISAIDIISRQGMCPVPGTSTLYSREFTEYCKKMREEDKCIHYQNTRKSSGGLSVESKKLIEEISPKLPMHVEEFTDIASELCPYELSIALAKKADAIVCDYFYLFNPPIRDIFLSKTGKSIEDLIIIIDEGHNVPERIRELMSDNLSTLMISRAKNEAKKLGFEEFIASLDAIRDIIKELGEELKPNAEAKVKKSDLISKIKEPYQELYERMQAVGDDIRSTQKQSFIGAVGEFLEHWLGEDEGFVRIIKRRDDVRNPFIVLSYKCLDPSLISAEVIRNSHSTIMMSGTLTPTEMYRDILGFPKNTVEKEYPSPFPKENRLNMIVPNVTTKFTQRSPDEFKKIAESCAQITNTVPGNSIVFFPSYYLLDQIGKHFTEISRKTIMQEYRGLTKTEKEETLDKFREYKKTGAVLLACASGSFGEGIDLPDDELRCVVVVGLPLQPPDIEKKELINYYDSKYGRGWDYGYILPAITKTLQNAGRCIRSESDKGVIAFLDRRYLYQNYSKCFPKDWNMGQSNNPEEDVKRFFS